ncbi:GpE family phage tail protein [Mannheimia sp. AT1]|uniref:GpE family phage tail protein n=1 Tax=Mannheimia cairinae TaxID=3025936 RepID=A0ABT5MTZ6_9PAST|nr:GpE family phage tail protein [Mannheimia cairinae]MDD0824377.1 GpE family phage tail protein [Mannheimia cairinae]MDD0826500.1 GpE family phage tail protein [Mannheimia cairinae]
MWWYGWQPSEVEEMTLEDIERWLKQAQRQVNAQYTKAAV